MNKFLKEYIVLAIKILDKIFIIKISIKMVILKINYY